LPRGPQPASEERGDGSVPDSRRSGADQPPVSGCPGHARCTCALGCARSPADRRLLRAGRFGCASSRTAGRHCSGQRLCRWEQTDRHCRCTGVPAAEWLLCAGCGRPLQDELGQQVLALVMHQIAARQVADWLRAHLVPLPSWAEQTAHRGRGGLAMPLRMQRAGADWIVVLPPEVVSEHGLREGDEVLVLVVKTADRTAFEEALRRVLREHATTFEYLKDT